MIYKTTNSQIPNEILSNIYNECFSDIAIGYFLEVGAFDGVICCNTDVLAHAGWHGIYIEPHLEPFTKCANLYKNNSNIQMYNCGISNKTEMLTLHVQDLISTFESSGSPYDRITNKNTKRKIECVTLNNILEQSKFQYLDVLSVDVEGFEDKAFEGFDIDKYMPTLCLVELHAGQNAEGKPSPYYNKELVDNVEKYLYNYNLIYIDHINSVYKRK